MLNSYWHNLQSKLRWLWSNRCYQISSNMIRHTLHITWSIAVTYSNNIYIYILHFWLFMENAVPININTIYIHLHHLDMYLRCKVCDHWCHTCQMLLFSSLSAAAGGPPGWTRGSHSSSRPATNTLHRCIPSEADGNHNMERPFVALWKLICGYRPKQIQLLRRKLFWHRAEKRPACRLSNEPITLH